MRKLVKTFFQGGIDTSLTASCLLKGSDADAVRREAQLLLTFWTFSIELFDDILRGLQYITLIQKMITV
jgi:hypothetical protein